MSGVEKHRHTAKRIHERLRDGHGFTGGITIVTDHTGYRGSPLGTIDMALWQAGRFAADAGIRFNPGVNEDLAATAVWGTQQVHLFDDATVDGVFAMVYAKGPGIDRSGDALKHGNTAGTSPHGGVLVLAGDDHTCKSSTSAHQSEFALVDAMIPILHPAGVQEFLDFGLHGWALSRFSGLWAGFKLVSETVDTTATVEIDPARVQVVLPTDVTLSPDGVHLRLPDDALAKEKRLHRYKLDLASAYVRANGLDRRIFGRADARLGIVSTGKSYLDVPGRYRTRSCRGYRRASDARSGCADGAATDTP